MPPSASPQSQSANTTRWARAGLSVALVVAAGASSALAAGAGADVQARTTPSSFSSSAPPGADVPAPSASARGAVPALGESAGPALLAPVGSATPATTCLSLHERAQEERFQGNLLAARSILSQCAEAECPTIVHTDCVTWLGETVRLIPTVRFELNTVGPDPSTLALFLDEQRMALGEDEAIALDPGSYRLRVEAKGYRAFHELLVVRQGEKNRTIAIELEQEVAARARELRSLESASTEGSRRAVQPETWASFMPAVSYAFAGLAIAGAGGALYWGRTAAEDMQEAYDTCSPICSAAVSQRIYRKQLLSDVSAGASVLSAAIAATLFLLSPATGTEETVRAPLGLEVGGNSVLLRHWRTF